MSLFKKKKKKIQPSAIFPCVPASSLIGDLLQPSLVDKRHLKTKSLKWSDCKTWSHLQKWICEPTIPYVGINNYTIY